MKKIYSTMTMLAMMIAAFSFTTCGDNDDDDIDNGGGSVPATLKALNGPWTAVGCSYAPTSKDISELANVTFFVDRDYDGGDVWYDLWSQDLNDHNNIEMEGSTVYSYDSPIFTIKSFRGDQMEIQVPNLSNAVLNMKKFDSLDDDDYKYKLSKGAWQFGLNTDGNGDYLNIPQDSNFKYYVTGYTYYTSVAKFLSDGTGVLYTSRSSSKFTWDIKDRKLSINYNGDIRETTLRFVSIEGRIYLKYSEDIW